MVATGNETTYLRASRAILETIFQDWQPRTFAVRFWDGSVWGTETQEEPRFTLVLRHPGALRQMFLPPTELALAEAYLFDDFDIEGDIEAIFPVAKYLRDENRGLAAQVRLGAELLRLPDGRSLRPQQGAQLDGQVHSIARDRQAIAYHYNRSNAFYALWLGKRMVYSCAYFATPQDDLDTAQERKLDYICRKLRLRPGERLLDIGCGWGGLVIYAAQHYGVKAHGITLSAPQAELANERIQAAGLADRCTVEVRDYREIETPGAYDKLVSVGMFEHVGQALLPTYFAQALRLLRPGGAFLNHGIAIHRIASFSNETFLGRYVFPDGDLVPIYVTLRAAEEQGFEIRDVESLREHYTLTLRHWVRNLEAHADEVRRVTDDLTYRVWRLYMSGSVYGFLSNENTVYQTLLVKPQHGVSFLPLSRADWYRV